MSAGVHCVCLSHFPLLGCSSVAPLGFASLFFFCSAGVKAVRALSLEHGRGYGFVASEWSLSHTSGLQCINTHRK